MTNRETAKILKNKIQGPKKNRCKEAQRVIDEIKRMDKKDIEQLKKLCDKFEKTKDKNI